jgi:8-oxo-dGTP diphosphatase
VVVLVLQNHQGDYLITQRQSGKHLAGFWEFPGGKQEHNESLEQALNRESREELDYQPPSPQPLITIDHHYPEHSVTLHVFHQFDPAPVVQPQEDQAMRWVNLHTLQNVTLPDANQPIVEKLRDMPVMH